jgi:hypothetical protein
MHIDVAFKIILLAFRAYADSEQRYDIEWNNDAANTYIRNVQIDLYIGINSGLTPP